MSAHFHGSPFRSRRRHLNRPATNDLDTTTDVHEENTTDLEPVTADIVPDEVPASTLASTTQPRVAQGPPPAEIKAVEPAVIARPVEPPRDSTGPIVARDAPAAEPPKLREVVDRAPLGRREPF